MRYVRAFTLGTFVFGIMVAAGALVLSALSTAGGGPSAFELGLGPVEILRVRHGGGATETSVGPGALVLALAGGTLNCIGLVILRRRQRVSDPIA